MNINWKHLMKGRKFLYGSFIGVLALILFGCGSAPSQSANSAGLDLDTVIKEAATQMERRIPSGTMIALVSVASPSTAFSTQVLTRLESAIVSSGKLVVVDRANLDKVRAEQGFQLSGEVDDESAKSIGKLLGAGAIVTGSLTDLGDVYSLTLKAINIETATVAVSYLADLSKTARIETLLASRDGAASGGTAQATTVRAQPAASSASTSTITSTVPAEPPPVPMNLKALTVTRTSVDMSWEVVGGRTVSYRVYYGTSNNPVTAALAGNTRTASYRIDNLQGGNKYYFWVSTVDNGVESPKSESISAETPNTFQIGERGPAGGWIFYDKGVITNGWRYMEAAPNDIGPAQWGAKGTDVNGINTSVGTGRANTQRIVPVLNQAGDDGAALLCDSLNINGHTGWFLPSLDELNLMYVNLKAKGLGGFSNGRYWSSSQGSGSWSSPAICAWTQDFSNGSQNAFHSIQGGPGEKHNTYLVRAARQF